MKPRPGYDHRFEPGERLVPDPLEPGARRLAAVNIRESAIAHMRSRNRIDAAQEAAGERYRRLYEAVTLGWVKAIDPTEEPVQGRRLGDPLTDAMVHAMRELDQARAALGPKPAYVLELVLVRGSIESAASVWSRSGGMLRGRRAEGYVSGVLVDALDALVRHWRLEGRGTPHPKIRAAQVTTTGPAREVSIGRLGDVVVDTHRPRLDGRGPLMASATPILGFRAPRSKIR